MIDLSNLNLVSQNDVVALQLEEVNHLIKQLNNGWYINHIGHLSKIFKFIDFMSAMNFANMIAQIAEEENHHPELKISWAECTIEIWTHEVNSLSAKDFIFAAKTEHELSKIS